MTFNVLLCTFSFALIDNVAQTTSTLMSVKEKGVQHCSSARHSLLVVQF